MSTPVLEYGHGLTIEGNTMSEQIEWITVAEAAEIMEVSASNVRYLCRNKRIVSQKFGKSWQVSKQAAEAYVRSDRYPEWLHDE